MSDIARLDPEASLASRNLGCGMTPTAGALYAVVMRQPALTGMPGRSRCPLYGANRRQYARCEPGLMSPMGTSRHFAAARQFGRFRTGADIRPDFMSTRPNQKRRRA